MKAMTENTNCGFDSVAEVEVVGKVDGFRQEGFRCEQGAKNVLDGFHGLHSMMPAGKSQEAIRKFIESHSICYYIIFKYVQTISKCEHIKILIASSFLRSGSKTPVSIHTPRTGKCPNLTIEFPNRTRFHPNRTGSIPIGQEGIPFGI